MYRKRMTKRKFIEFIKSNWMKLLFGLLLLIFIIPRVVKYLKTKSEEIKRNKIEEETLTQANENTYLSPAKLEEKAKRSIKKYPLLTKAKVQEIINSSHNLALALGTNASSNRPWFGWEFLPDRPDPNAFFEDEDKAVSILKKYPGTFPALAEFYFSVATRGRNLKVDINRYLSKTDIESVKKQWKKYGNYNWL